MDLSNMMGQLGDLQKKMEESKAKLETIFVEGEAEGVKVSMSANKKVDNISIPETLLTADNKEQLEDLLLAAMNRALENAENVAMSEMQGVGSSMFPGGLPPF